MPETAGRGAHGRTLTVLQLQMLLTAICILTALLLRFVLPGAFAQVRQEYLLLFEQQDADEELIRFAQAALDRMFLPADAAAKAPDGCSLETYLPGQSYTMPLASFTVSSAYGWRKHPISGEYTFHNGMDLACAEGTPVYAAMAGMVQRTGSDAASGNYIVLLHSDGVATSYCHLQYVFVRAGEFLVEGQPIGTAGQTGLATGPHLHFSLLHNDVRYDPSAMLGG